MPARWLCNIVWILCLAGGCASYNDRLDPTVRAYRAGDFAAAARLAGDLDLGRQDRLLGLLERGKALQDAGQHANSAAVFAEADKLLEVFESQPLVRLSEETGSVLVNDTVREYRGTHADAILLSTYQALNYVALGDIQQARVQLRRAYRRQQLAVQANAGRIEDAQKRASREGLDLSRVLGNAPGTAGRLDRVETRITPAYADFANPFTTFLGGVVATLAGDTSDAQVEFRRAAGMVPRNTYAATLAAGEGLIEAWRRGDGYVVVLYEGGLGPRLEEVGLPILTRNGGYTEIYLPVLNPAPPPPPLLLQTPTGTFETAPLADVSAIRGQEYLANLPATIVRLALSATAKELGTRQMRKEYDEIGIILGSVYKLATAQADLRLWRTTGSGFEVAAFAPPPDGRVTLRLPGGAATTVTTPPEAITILLVRGVSGNLSVTPVIFGPDRGPSLADERRKGLR
ncbi:MAG: hypothetical protein ACFCVE_05060 [Phycisphaerae bacterium]